MPSNLKKMKRILFSFVLSILFVNAFAQIPAGYYNNAIGTGATLKTQLKTIITTGHATNISYDELWGAYATTDRDQYYENDSSILDIYSENPTATDPYNFIYNTNRCSGTNGPEGYCYNREHIVPQSLFNQQLPMKSDAHFIRATDQKVNGERGNLPFGIVESANYQSQNGSKRGTSASPGFTGTVFEPINEFKGDVARMIFYFVTRYESQLSGFSTGNMLGGSAYPGLQQWELNQLILWHIQDPVSATEISRNNATYIFQGNRNPYIDNPSYVTAVWGTPVIDTQAPTAPTNLIANNPTSSTVALSWAASTDNVGVAGYDIYANSVYKATISGTTATVQGLTPLTAYSFYVIAKDAAGNPSPQSNIANETTLAGQPGGSSCGTEDFSNIPTSTNPAYATRTWTNNGITWTSTDSRVDEVINGKAITLRDGELTSTTLSGGIQNLQIKTQLKYGSTAGTLNVLINGNLVGTIPYTADKSMTIATINNINISGNVVIKIVNPPSTNNGNRVAIDDLSWTCFSALSTSETIKEKSFSIYPNPVKNNELFIKAENLNKIVKAEIYDLSGKLIMSIANPFKNSNKINLHGITKGVYILKTDNSTSKFIVD